MSWGQGGRGYHPHLVRGELVKTDDSQPEQYLDLYGLDGETLMKVYRPQPFGLSTHAPVGSNGVLISFGGERNESVLVGGEHPDKRPTGLDEGAAKLYDADGNVIWMGLKNGIQLSATNGAAMVQSTKGTVTLDAQGHVYANPNGGNNVYLGMKEPGGAKVMTESGPSSNTYAMV